METRMTQITKQVIFDKEVAVLGTLEEPLFRAKDVCAWLDETNAVQMLRTIPEDRRPQCIKKIKQRNGATVAWVNYLTEFGVYYILMRSRKPKAAEYQYKICEILKSIRLKGYAVSDSITEEQIAQLKKDAESKEMILKAQGGVIRLDDRFISTLKELIDLYENKRSELSVASAVDLFDKQK